MSDLRQLKRKMKTVVGIQQITKAMKMVASVRIKKAERAMKAAQPFAHKFKEVVDELCSQSTEVYHPLMELHKEINKVLLLVVTSDKGLCGSYNSNVLRETQRFLLNNSDKQIELMVLGLKGIRFFGKRKLDIVKEVPGWDPVLDLARALVGEIRERYIKQEVDEVYLVYNFPQSTMVQRETLLRLLPFRTEDAKVTPSPILFEPAPGIILKALLPKYLEVMVYQVLLEARAAELGARLRAMTNATDNAQEFLNELRLKFFRARQEAITNEILEITSGAEALRRA